MKNKLPPVGRNIRYLRRQNGWTLAMLAAKIGICEGPLGRIERGLNAPSAIVIYKLAKEFDVRIDTLFAEERCEIGPVIQPQAARGCFPVQIHGETRNFPACVTKMAHELIKAFQALEDICEVQKRAKVPLHTPFEFSKMGIEELSSAMRHFMGIGDGVLFDYFELFETYGFRAITVPMPRDFDGFSYYDSLNQNVFFFVNSSQNAERRLFCLAMELGKVMILTQSMMSLENDPITGKLAAAGAEKDFFTVEKAAKHFAANFLMPGKAVLDTVSQLGIRNKCWSWDLLLRIKHRFGVSAQSFLYRLNELDLIHADISEEFEKKIREHYIKTNKGEPGLSKRILSPNGRFWDLVFSGKDIIEARKEVMEIEQVMFGWRIPGA